MGIRRLLPRRGVERCAPAGTQQVAEATRGGNADPADGREAGERWWRSLNVRQGASDVGRASLLEQQQDALHAYRANPLAYRIVELMTAYVLGQGVGIGATEPASDAFVRRFWRHPLNQMDARLPQWCTELSLAGELFITFHTNQYDGMTFVRAAPASQIDEIEVDAQDSEREVRYHQAGGLSDAGRGAAGRWWPAADMRHYAVNRVVGAQRGTSDLAPILPWLSRYKDWLTDRVIINKFKGAYLWDVTLQGASAATIRAKQADLAALPPTPGSAVVHNEAEVWKAVQPQINAEAVEADGKALRLAIAAGAGIPLHFLAEGESATRATAQEMSEPTRRHYQKRQAYVGWLIRDVIGEVVRRAVQAGALAPGADAAWNEGGVVTWGALQIEQGGETDGG